MLESKQYKESETQAKKLENLEKFIASVKEAPQKQPATSPGKAEPSFEASSRVQQDLLQLKSTNESLNFKLEGLKYDLELLKEDIVRQRTSQRNYLEKIEAIEKRVGASSTARQDAHVAISDSNFMAQSSKLDQPDAAQRFQQRPAPRFDQDPGKPGIRPINTFGRMESLQGGFMEDADRMSLNRGDFEAGNISMIERAAIGTHSSPDNSLLLEEDFFRSNHAGRFLSGTEEVKPKATVVTTHKTIPESRYLANQYEAGLPSQRPGPTGDSGHATTADSKQPRSAATNTSLLNQSLNSSIRMNRKTLESVTPEIARQLERKKTNQSLHQSIPPQNQPGQEREDSIIEMNVDEEGFLLDQDGNYVLDDKGHPMKLTEEQIENLRENGLYDSEEEDANDD